MTLNLAAGPTSLERLDTALARMQQKHDFRRVDRDDEQFSDELTALLLTEDPLRNPEVLDACVILPEALKPLGERIVRRVAGPEVAPALSQRYGVARPPAVVFLRCGQFVGVLPGIRDWRDYQAEVERLLAGPAQPKPIGIPVRTADGQGACA